MRLEIPWIYSNNVSRDFHTQSLLFSAVLVVAAACRTVTPGLDPGRLPVEEAGEAGVPDLADSDAPDASTELDEASIQGDSIAETRPDRLGRAVTTVFSGYELIREIVEKDGLEVTRLTIRGAASIRHDQVLIQADRMIIEDGRYGRLDGAVRFTDRKSGAQLFATRAEYFRDEQRAVLSGDPYIITRTAGQATTLVSCRGIVRDLAARTTTLDGDVRVHQDVYSMSGDRAVFTDEDRTLTVESNPLIFGRNVFLTGDRLVYETADRRIKLDGRVIYMSRTAPASRAEAPEGPPDLERFAREGGRSAEVLGAAEDDAESDDPAADESDLASTLSGQVLVHEFPREGVAKTFVRGDVLLTRGQSLRLSAPEITAYGRDFALLHVDQGVDMLDRERGVQVRARVLDFDRKEELLRLEGEPEIAFLDRQTAEPRATLRGAIIERDFRSGSTIAWGQVEIERDAYRAVGEMASYYEDQGVIILEGNPGLRGAGNGVYAEKILFYPEKNRILLYNRIRGYLGVEE